LLKLGLSHLTLISMFFSSPGSAAASTTGLLILPTGTLFGQNTPSKKLNIALIGVWGRGQALYKGLATENVVALCDVNAKNLAAAGDGNPDGTPVTPCPILSNGRYSTFSPPPSTITFGDPDRHTVETVRNFR
jgi:hypothetical protein